MGKNGRRDKKTEQGSIYSIYWSILHIWSHYIGCKGIYRDVFPTFQAKKSYGWWITRRRMEIHIKISEEKYLKESVQKYQEALRTFRRWKWCLRDFADTQEGCEIFSHQQVKLVGLQNWLPPWGSQRSSLRHVSGGFRRNSIALYKKAAKFSQQKADFATLWSDLLAMAVTPSFQLRIAHRLKHWILDFLSFEMVYRM